jgi:hypothetical protein
MPLSRDLADHSKPVSKMFSWPKNKSEWAKYKLSEDQLEHFKTYGYISNIKLLEEDQVDQLNEELNTIMDVKSPIHDLLYEFHTNESEDPDRIIFHSLGHWRMTPGLISTWILIVSHWCSLWVANLNTNPVPFTVPDSRPAATVSTGATGTGGWTSVTWPSPAAAP